MSLWLCSFTSNACVLVVILLHASHFALFLVNIFKMKKVHNSFSSLSSRMYRKANVKINIIPLYDPATLSTEDEVCKKDGVKNGHWLLRKNPSKWRGWNRRRRKSSWYYHKGEKDHRNVIFLSINRLKKKKKQEGKLNNCRARWPMGTILGVCFSEWTGSEVWFSCLVFLLQSPLNCTKSSRMVF